MLLNPMECDSNLVSILWPQSTGTL